MATFTTNFPELLETRQKEIFFKNFGQQPSLFRNLFKVKNSLQAFEDILEIAGLGTFATKPEGTPVAFDDGIQGTRRRTIHTTFALGFRVTMEALQDDQWNIIDKFPADLGDSARDHQDTLAWSLLNDGFAGATFTGLNGVSLFNTAQTNLRPEVANQSNSLTPAAALSVTGLESALTTYRTLGSREGRFLAVQPQWLLFHPDNEHNAYVLLNTEFRPGTSDNDRSTVVSTRSGLRPVADQGIPYLTATLAWSVHTGSDTNTLQWNDRMSLTFERAKDADTMDQKFYAVYRASVQFADFRGNVGSNFA